jgi:hypothetical protein
VGIKIQVEGLKEVEAKFARMVLEIGPVNEKALQKIGSDLQGKAQRLAPIDTGDLRGSGWHRMEKNAVIIGFSTPYALIQHERLDFNHPKGGQAKYLEAPFAENIPRYILMLQDANKKLGE